VLLGLFVVFKLFDKNLVNLLLTAYFVVRPRCVLFAHSTVFDFLTNRSRPHRIAAI